MKNLNLSSIKMIELNQLESIKIEGGHDGEAYQLGVNIGKGIDKGLKAIGIWLLLL